MPTFSIPLGAQSFHEDLRARVIASLDSGAYTGTDGDGDIEHRAAVQPMPLAIDMQQILMDTQLPAILVRVTPGPMEKIGDRFSRFGHAITLMSIDHAATLVEAEDNATRILTEAAMQLFEDMEGMSQTYIPTGQLIDMVNGTPFETGFINEETVMVSTIISVGVLVQGGFPHE